MVEHRLGPSVARTDAVRSVKVSLFVTAGLAAPGGNGQLRTGCSCRVVVDRGAWTQATYSGQRNLAETWLQARPAAGLQHVRDQRGAVAEVCRVASDRRPSPTIGCPFSTLSWPSSGLFDHGAARQLISSSMLMSCHCSDDDVVGVAEATWVLGGRVGGAVWDECLLAWPSDRSALHACRGWSVRRRDGWRSKRPATISCWMSWSTSLRTDTMLRSPVASWLSSMIEGRRICLT
jgi:hypothetical protein